MISSRVALGIMLATRPSKFVVGIFLNGITVSAQDLIPTRVSLAFEEQVDRMARAFPAVTRAAPFDVIEIQRPMVMESTPDTMDTAIGFKGREFEGKVVGLVLLAASLFFVILLTAGLSFLRILVGHLNSPRRQAREA